MKEQIKACVAATYLKEVDKAEAMQKVLRLIWTPENPAAFDKIELVFNTTGPHGSLYQNIKKLDDQYPITNELNAWLKQLERAYYDKPNAQMDLVELSADGFRDLLFALVTPAQSPWHRVFHFETLKDKLNNKTISPDLVISILSYCIPYANWQLKEGFAPYCCYKNWQYLIEVLKEEHDVSAERLFVLQFINNQALDGETETRFGNDVFHASRDIRLHADWLNSATGWDYARLNKIYIDGARHPAATIMRFGTPEQVQSMLKAYQNASSDDLQAVLLKPNAKGITALCEINAKKNGAEVLAQITRWMQAGSLDCQFIEALLSKSKFLPKMFSQQLTINNDLLIGFIKALDQAVHSNLVSYTTLDTFLTQTLPVKPIHRRGKNKEYNTFSYYDFANLLIGLGLKEEHEAAFTALLDTMTKWVKEGHLTHRALTKTLCRIIPTLLSYDVRCLHTLLTHLTAWVDADYLSARQLKQLLLPGGRSGKCADAIRSYFLQKPADDLSLLNAYWRRIITFYDQGLLDNTTMVYLLYDPGLSSSSGTIQNTIENKAVFNTELHLSLVHVVYRLLANFPEKMTNGSWIKRELQLAVQHSFTYRYEPQPGTLRKELAVYAIALGFPLTERPLFSKEQIFDAMLSFPLQSRILLLTQASDTSTSLGQYFKPLMGLFNKLGCAPNSSLLQRIQQELAKATSNRGVMGCNEKNDFVDVDEELHLVAKP